MMADFQFTWAVFTGVFSIVTVVPGCLLYIHSQLPSQKLRPMFESLTETDELLFTCVEEGLVYGTNADIYRSTLGLLRTRAEGARFEAHAARTYAEDVANWVKGLSRRITEIRWQVRDVRADISSNSLRERERQASLRQRATSETEDYQRVSESTSDTASSPVSSALSSVFGEIASAGNSAEGGGEVHPHAPTPPSARGRSDETVTASSSYLISTSPESAAELNKTSHSSMVMPLIARQSKKAGQSNRRHSVSSESSGGSSLQNMRRKKRGGDPLARARTMARFARQARATRTSPVFLVDPHSFASFEFVESDDDGNDEWIDEQAVAL